jgi:two-component system phosphate regulon sensor histidine kinase PhoR
MKDAGKLLVKSGFAFSAALFVVLLLLAFRLFTKEPIGTVNVVVSAVSVFLVTWYLQSFFTREMLSELKSVYQNIRRITSYQSVSKKIKNEELIHEINRLLDEWEKNKQDEIVQLKKLETFRKEFLSNVSHELKTPIFSVQGYIHTLLDGGIDDSDVNIHYLNKASRSIDRLIAIVEDLESISKFESGNLNLEIRIFDICDLCRDVMDSLEMNARERKITLEAHPGLNKKVYVNADKERIRQVLVNLVVNSIKYGKTGGKTIISVDDSADPVIVHVEDNGIGIEKEHLPRLFERFYRVDKSRSREQGGTGLGLAIVKHILEAHNQKVSVSSEPDKGSVFSFTLAKG